MCVGRMCADKRRNTQWNVKTTGCSLRRHGRQWEEDCVVGTKVKRDKCEKKQTLIFQCGFRRLLYKVTELLQKSEDRLFCHVNAYQLVNCEI